MTAKERGRVMYKPLLFNFSHIYILYVAVLFTFAAGLE
jgi:hypothetical protein